jgi:hypothetical protein
VGSVGTRHLKLDAMREEEHADGVVIKLVFIITLDAPDGATKLRGHKGKEVREGGEGVGLLAQRESPKVTVYEVKWLKGSSRGARKGQPDVPSKLADMTQGIISARGQVIVEVLDGLERTSGLGWPKRRCQVAEEAVVARAYGTTRRVVVGKAGRGRV